MRSRVSRAVVGAVAGAALGLSGLLLQRLTRNPLASPSLTGVTGGAALAALVTILYFPSVDLAALPAVTFVGAAAAAGTVAALAAGRREVTELALIGLVVAALLAAVRTGLLLSVNSEQVAGTLSYWLVGSLVGRDWTDLIAVGPYAVVGFVGCALLARQLPLLSLDDDVARSLGAPLARLRLLSLGLAALLAAAAVSVAGPVAFVGLAAPHLARLVTSADSTDPVLLTALVGAVVLCLADLAARTLAAPAEMPVGALTGLLVGPAVLLVLRPGRSR